MLARNANGSWEPKHNAITIGVLVAIGVSAIAFPAYLGKAALRTELPYELGIACLIIVGIEFGILHAVAAINRIMSVDFSRRAVDDAIRSLSSASNDPNLSEEMKMDIRKDLDEIRAIQREMIRGKWR